MSDRTPVETTSPAFGHLEYFLQLTLRGSTARITQAHTISNPLLTVPFEQRCKDLFYVEAWLDARDVDEVVKKGFGEGLVKVTLGQIPCEKEESGDGSLGATSTARLSYRLAATTGGASGSGLSVGTNSLSDYKFERRRKAILCKVGLGASYMVPHTTTAESAPSMPVGYASFVLSQQGTKTLKYTTAHYSSTNPNYIYTYLVPSDQILPLYLVEYTFDPAAETKSREKHMCDLCEKNKADVYCPSDKAMLCKDCDLQLHTANKLASRHQRHSVNRSLNVWGNCREHTEQPVEFFCSQCFMPVCVYCKMVGHHASGSAARHVLVNTMEAYQTIMEESREPDPVLQSRLEYLQTCLKQLSTHSAAVEQHAHQIKLDVDAAYHAALASLKTITDGKLKVLASSKIEVERQILEIQRAEEFLRYQRENASRRCEFLACWTKHQSLRNELKNRPVKECESVELDIRFEGNLHVECGCDNPKGPLDKLFLEPTAPPALWSDPAGGAAGGVGNGRAEHGRGPTLSSSAEMTGRESPNSGGHYSHLNRQPGQQHHPHHQQQHHPPLISRSFDPCHQSSETSQRSGSIGGLARSIFLQQNKRVMLPSATTAVLQSSSTGTPPSSGGGAGAGNKPHGRPGVVGGLGGVPSSGVSAGRGGGEGVKKKQDVFGEALMTFDRQHSRSSSVVSGLTPQ